MTNTEFEELDKAVNSLIGDKKKPVDDNNKAPLSVPARSNAPKGRFMDLRHPSSDMKPQSPTVPKRAPEPTPTPPQPAPKPTLQPTPPKPVENKAPLSDQKPDEESGQSPFLPDASVQKRPLGGNINSEPSSPPAPKDNPNSPLPEELQNGVMSIESSETEDTAASSALTSTHTPDKVAEETTAQPQTAAYHQPIKHSNKKGPLTWIVWILILVITGAATGAAVYFWVLPLI
jgi:hypothetical protein